MKVAFLAAFSQESMMNNPNRRLNELDWLKALVRFQSDIVRCPECGNEIFINNATTTNCDNCGKPFEVKHTFVLPEYCITAAKNTRVYRCQIGACNADRALDLVCRVMQKKDDPNMQGVMNMTKDTLVGITSSGKSNPIKPGTIVPLKSGITIKAFDSKIIIK